jgi:thiamine-monophosphate kinase
MLKNKEWDIIRYITKDRDSYIGDDCAVWDEPGLVVTTDHMCEGTHFDLSFMKPESIGWRLMAANASDVISMGSLPSHFLLNIAAPTKNIETIKKIVDGITLFSDKYDLEILGGDTTAAEKITVGVTMFGKKTAKPLLRSGAKPGDRVYLTEPVGLSQCGLYHLKNGTPGFEQSKEKFLFPDPFKTRPADIKNANCAIDISDSLLSELELISKASNVGIEIDLEKIPVHEEVLKTAQILGVKVEQIMFSSGEEFSLILTSENKMNGLYHIGFIKESGDSKIEIISKNGAVDSSSFSVFSHFS